MMKKSRNKLLVILALSAVLCFGVILATILIGKNADMQKVSGIEFTARPDLYTWKEYQNLSLEDQDAFFEKFDSVESFEAWMEDAKPVEAVALVLEWNKPGKTPDAYTWEEYQQLTSEEREAFYLWFASDAAFETWMESVKPVETAEPAPKWERAGKNPDQYTWKEYQTLSPREQDAFFTWFDSVKAFEAWMEQAKPAEATEPAVKWDKPGKNPDQYTWEEYQALTPRKQDAFFSWFDSKIAFETWMEKVRPMETTVPAMKWDKFGKTPDTYTWEEYQMLTPQEQDAFYAWFDSVKAFEAWMERVKPAEAAEPVGKWDKPGKTPDAYTWGEYQALTPREQDMFFLWFDSVEAFETWMNAATGTSV